MHILAYFAQKKPVSKGRKYLKIKDISLKSTTYYRTFS